MPCIHVETYVYACIQTIPVCVFELLVAEQIFAHALGSNGQILIYRLQLELSKAAEGPGGTGKSASYCQDSEMSGVVINQANEACDAANERFDHV